MRQMTDTPADGADALPRAPERTDEAAPPEPPAGDYRCYSLDVLRRLEE